MSQVARRDVFQAIADPNRREIISLLSEGELNMKTIANHFKMSRQAISLHVKILEECQIISISRNGRERLCRVDFTALSEVHDWTSQFEAFWCPKLKALGRVVSENRKTRSNKSNKKRKG